MKKENVKVAVTDKEQAEMYLKILKFLGEKTYDSLFKRLEYNCFLSFDINDKDWFLFHNEHSGLETRQLITFGKLVDLLTRKPLIISEDGIELFEGDVFYEASNHDGDGIFIVYHTEYKIHSSSRVVVNTDNHKAFSTKQAALDWIEKINKPKEIRIDFSGCTTANVSKNAVKLDWIGGCISLGNDEIKQIMDAFDRIK